MIWWNDAIVFFGNEAEGAALIFYDQSGLKLIWVTFDFNKLVPHVTLLVSLSTDSLQDKFAELVIPREAIVI